MLHWNSMCHIRIYRLWLENEEVINIFNARKKEDYIDMKGFSSWSINHKLWFGNSVEV